MQCSRCLTISQEQVKTHLYSRYLKISQEQVKTSQVKTDSLVVWHMLQQRFLEHAVGQVSLLVVVGRKHQEEYHALQCLVALGGLLQHQWGDQHGTVVAARGQVAAFVAVKLNHQPAQRIEI